MATMDPTTPTDSRKKPVGDAATLATAAWGSDATGPWIHTRMREGRAEVRGQCHAQFGHRIPSAAQAVADGIFAGWDWDGKRLVVSNDRYGFFPMFWCRLPNGGVCVSPSLVALVEQGAPTDLDIEALSVFLRLGYFVGNDTPFVAIRVVPPNASFEWENGQLTCQGRYPSSAKPTACGRDDAIDEYIDLFARAMARRTPAGPFAVPISGGRDSRHILLEMHRTGFTPTTCISVIDNPPDPNEDPRIAGILCKELGFPFAAIDQQLSTFAAQVRKNRETHFCATSHGWYLALADALNGRFECAYDGIAGDVLSQSKFLTSRLNEAFHSRDFDSICDALQERQGSNWPGTSNLVQGELIPALDPAIARGRLVRELGRHLDQPNPVASFILWNRTRREIALAPYALLKGVPHVYAPFLDHALFDFLATLPSHMVMDHRFHDDTIARAYPKFAHIPYADHNVASPDDSRERARFLVEAARAFVLKRPSRLMKNLGPRTKMLAAVLSRGHLRPWLSPLLIYLDQIESIARGSFRRDAEQAAAMVPDGGKRGV